ncbi:MAG: prepilin-type N-terminal cleavage/methylation domain-containing protein [Erysipelotrichia bacterium]|nr:prepilin-type N-terminal cleavage/methylation domain-containing protein [Erysipelotrichia bacterium]
MNRRQGFTLMELLLVVAVLAIVAAAAAPTFFSGANEAMDEAKRSSFLSAYSNTLSAANMYLSIKASKAETVKDPTTLDDLTLSAYVPTAARQVKVSDTKTLTLTAKYEGNKVNVYSGGTVVTATATWTIISGYPN